MQIFFCPPPSPVLQHILFCILFIMLIFLFVPLPLYICILQPPGERLIDSASFPSQRCLSWAAFSEPGQLCIGSAWFPLPGNRCIELTELPVTPTMQFPATRGPVNQSNKFPATKEPAYLSNWFPENRRIDLSKSWLIFTRDSGVLVPFNHGQRRFCFCWFSQ